MPNALKLIAIVLLLLFITIKSEGQGDDKENKGDARVEIPKNSHCAKSDTENLQEIGGLEATAAECELNDVRDHVNHEIHETVSMYANDKRSQEWAEWRRLIEEAETQYRDAAGQRSKCQNESCDCYRIVIDNDLQPFKTGISKALIEEAIPRGVLYQILDGKLFRNEDCSFPARCSGIEHFLLEIIQDLPNMEFVINVSDYPQIPNFEGSNKPVVPVLSFSKTQNFMDIFYPAWSFWDGGPSISIFPRGLGRWDLLRKSLIKASDENPWSSRINQAFFRGSRTSAERDPLVLLSRSNPELVNAKYTKNQAWRSDADTLHEPAAKEVTLEDHCSYKYLFNFRGVSASFRFKHLFLCKSLVFHVGDEWEEFFYGALKPWIHYIPVKKDSTEEELRSLIEFVQFHDSSAEKIAIRGYKFIKANLRLSQVRCYWKELLTKYAALLDYKVFLRKDLIQIGS